MLLSLVDGHVVLHPVGGLIRAVSYGHLVSGFHWSGSSPRQARTFLGLHPFEELLESVVVGPLVGEGDHGLCSVSVLAILCALVLGPSRLNGIPLDDQLRALSSHLVHLLS